MLKKFNLNLCHFARLALAFSKSDWVLQNVRVSIEAIYVRGNIHVDV